MERLREIAGTVRRTIDRYATRPKFDPLVPADEFLMNLPQEEQERATALATIIRDMGLDFPAGIGVMGDIAVGGAGIDLTIAGREQALTHDERIQIQKAIRTRLQSSGWKFTEGDTRKHFEDMPQKYYSILTQTPTDIDEIPISVITDTPYFNLPTAPTRTMVVLISDQSTSQVINSHTANRTPLAVLV